MDRVRTTCGSGWLNLKAAKGLPAKFEIRPENPHIECEPNRVEDVLHRHAVGTKSKVRVQQLPREVQRQGVERNGVRLVAEADADAVNVDNRPADAADDGKKNLNRFDVDH